MNNYKSNNNISKFLRFLLTADHNEDWKEIPNTQGRYYISSKGNVLSVCNNEPRILKPYICGGGYQYVDIDRKNIRVNRLVAKAFLPLPEDDNNNYIVHHKDHNKLNNNLLNLEWVTYSENTQYYDEYQKELYANGETIHKSAANNSK